MSWNTVIVEGDSKHLASETQRLLNEGWTLWGDLQPTGVLMPSGEAQLMQAAFKEGK